MAKMTEYHLTGLQKEELDEDFILSDDPFNPELFSKFLSKMEPNQFYTFKFPSWYTIQVRTLDRYLQELMGCGLDVGKGGAEFGYRMPLPEKDSNSRNLVIFRRR